MALSPERIYSIGRDLTAFAPRIPGTASMDGAASYLRHFMERLGMEVRMEPVDFTGVFFRSWSFIPGGPGTEEIPSFPQNNSAPGDVEAEIVSVGKGRERDYRGKDVRGKIVLADWGTLHDNEIPCGLGKRYPLLAAYDRAVERGAAAMAGFFSDAPGNALKLMEPGIRPVGGSNVPGSCEDPADGRFLLPVLCIGWKDGMALAGRLSKGKVVGRVRVDAARKASRTNTIIGFLPGTGNRAVAVGAHYCTAFEGAVCDTGGTAGALALAEHWAALPRSKRKTSLYFIFSGSHVWINCNISSRNFIRNNPGAAGNLSAMLWMDHITAPARRAGWRRLFRPGTVLLSMNPVMCLFAFLSLLKNRKMPRLLPLSRLWTLCEMGPFDCAGVPSLSLQVGDPVMLTTEDTWDRIDPGELAADTGFYLDMIRFLQKTPRWLVRLFEVPGRSLFGCGTLFRDADMPRCEHYQPEPSLPLYRGGETGPVEAGPASFSSSNGRDIP